jgi:hypothetical protein
MAEKKPDVTTEINQILGDGSTGTSDGAVEVVAVKNFRGTKEEGEKDPGDKWRVPRDRAAELFANGLVNYTNPADEQDAAQQAADAAAQNALQNRRTAPTSKTTNLAGQKV